MPYLHLKTNVTIDSHQTQSLLSHLSKQLARETGKPERYVLVEMTCSNNMLFAGISDPLAYVECKSIGLTTAQAKTLSATLAQSLNADLSIAPDRIYIEFSNCPAEFWGWNGGTFA